MARVLVIEDEPGIAMVLKIALSDEGHEVVTAFNGVTGLKLLNQAPSPEIVFVDLNMPGLSGRAVIETMIGRPGLKGIPVVIISGSMPGSPHFPPRGTYNAIITKPFDLNDVIETANYLTGTGQIPGLFNSPALIS